MASVVYTTPKISAMIVEPLTWLKKEVRIKKEIMVKNYDKKLCKKRKNYLVSKLLIKFKAWRSRFH